MIIFIIVCLGANINYNSYKYSKMSDSFDDNNITDSVNNDINNTNINNDDTNNDGASNSEDENVYNFERKKKLANRISGIRDKPLLRAIRDIIYKENPGIVAKKSSGGYLMYFQNYAPITYLKIDNAINKFESRKKEKLYDSNSSAKFSNKSNNVTESSDKPNITSSEEPNEYNGKYTRLRYSNRERRLIKRQQYEDIINEQIDEIITHSASNADNNENHIVVASKELVAPDESITKDDGKIKNADGSKNTKNTKITNNKGGKSIKGVKGVKGVKGSVEPKTTKTGTSKDSKKTKTSTKTSTTTSTTTSTKTLTKTPTQISKKA